MRVRFLEADDVRIRFEAACLHLGEGDNALPIGTRLGEFELIGQVGVGGFGIVYLAEDHSLGRRVALKVVTGDSEVGVIPGWVLVSRITSPSRPRGSSQRKSVRLRPRQSSASCARRA